jgi:hypothetical protein
MREAARALSGYLLRCDQAQLFFGVPNPVWECSQTHHAKVAISSNITAPEQRRGSITGDIKSHMSRKLERSIPLMGMASVNSE